jgi:hypothetical protein
MDDAESNKELVPLIHSSLIYWDDEFQSDCAKMVQRAVSKKVSNPLLIF